MLNNINKTDFFYDYYAQWITVYKEGAIRKVTMDKYLLTQSWIKRLAPDLKVCELTRITYQKLLNDYAKEHERQTTMDFHHQLKGAILDAVDEGLIERDPTRKAIIKGKKPRYKKIKYVAYRVTPIYEGNNLVCSGVQIEAYSVEDSGEGICFNVYCYNVQPGITIDYATGNSSGPQSSTTSKPETTKPAESVTQPPAEQPGNTDMVWIPKSGSKYHSRSSCSNMKNPTQVSRSEAIRRGYEPCKKCY